MLPRRLLEPSLRQAHDGEGSGRNVVVPRYVTSRDRAWLEALLEFYRAHHGQKRGALRERLHGVFADERVPRGSPRVAAHLLDRATRNRLLDANQAREVRAVVFEAREQASTRGEALAIAAAKLRVRPDDVEALLFADLDSEDRVGPFERSLTCEALALEVNLALAGALLARALSVDVRVRSRSHALVREARRAGLICHLSRGRGSDVSELGISGPFVLFRQTQLYGRKLASLLPLLGACEGYALEAKVVLGAGRPALLFRLTDKAPLPRRDGPLSGERTVVTRLARDLQALGARFVVEADPEPLHLESGRLLLPDLAVRDLRAPSRRFFVEVSGFWTAQHLARELATLDETRRDGYLFCADRRLAARDEPLPEHPGLLAFERRVDAAEVLARIEAWASRAELAARSPLL
ncbi:MAG: DUF790 family protein [Polyangiaceae bacterium]